MLVKLLHSCVLVWNSSHPHVLRFGDQRAHLFSPIFHYTEILIPPTEHSTLRQKYHLNDLFFQFSYAHSTVHTEIRFPTRPRDAGVEMEIHILSYYGTADNFWWRFRGRRAACASFPGRSAVKYFGVKKTTAAAAGETPTRWCAHVCMLRMGKGTSYFVVCFDLCVCTKRAAFLPANPLARHGAWKSSCAL